MCRILGISRSAYYHWIQHPKSADEIGNEELAAIAEKIHRAHPDMGYRRLGDELSRECGRRINDKRMLRICRAKKIQSAIKWKPKCCPCYRQHTQQGIHRIGTGREMADRCLGVQILHRWRDPKSLPQRDSRSL